MQNEESLNRVDNNSSKFISFKEDSTKALTELNNENQKVKSIQKAWNSNIRKIPSKAKLTENFILKNNKRLESLKEIEILNESEIPNEILTKRFDTNNISEYQGYRNHKIINLNLSYNI